MKPLRHVIGYRIERKYPEVGWLGIVSLIFKLTDARAELRRQREGAHKGQPLRIVRMIHEVVP